MGRAGDFPPGHRVAIRRDNLCSGCQANGQPTIFANSEHPTLLHLHHKLDQAALESRRTHCTTPKTAIPDAKTYVGGACSTHHERAACVTTNGRKLRFDSSRASRRTIRVGPSTGCTRCLLALYSERSTRRRRRRPGRRGPIWPSNPCGHRLLPPAAGPT